MFANVLRAQAKSSLRTAARAAVPSARNYSSFLSRSVLPSFSLHAGAFTRAFSNSRQVNFERRETRNDPSDTVYVGNMPWSVSEQELKDLFSEFGSIKNLRIMTHASGRPKGFGYITFNDKQSAKAAVASATQEPIFFGGRDLVIDYAKSLGDIGLQLPSSKLYFTNFNSEEDLKSHLSRYSNKVAEIFFLRNGDTGEKLRSGFVQFDSIDTASQVIEEFNETRSASGDTITLAFARPRRNDMPREGRGAPSRRGSYVGRSVEEYA